MRVVLRSALVASLIALTIPTVAQTAHFLGITSPTGITGLSYPGGLARDAAGNIFVADSFHGQVDEFTFNGSTYATTPTIITYATSNNNYPTAVALDTAGNLFIADTSLGSLVEVFYNGGAYSNYSTIQSGIQPYGVAVDTAGNLFYASVPSSGDRAVYEMPLTNGSYGSPVELDHTNFSFPLGIAVDTAGNVYVADSGNYQVHKIPYSNGSYGTSTSIGGSLSFSPSGVAVDAAGNVYAAGSASATITKIPYVNSAYQTPIQLGSGSYSPYGITVDSAGNLFFSDDSTGSVIKIAQSVSFPASAVSSSPQSQTLNFTIDTAGTLSAPAVLTQGAPNLDFTLDTNNSTCTAGSQTAATICSVVVKLSPKAPGLRTGAVELLDSNNNLLATVTLSGIGTGPAITFPSSNSKTSLLGDGLNTPYGIAVDAAGNVYVSDNDHNVVKKFPYSAGAYTNSSTIGSGFDEPIGVAVDAAGDVFVTDALNNVVKMIPYIAGNYGTPVTVGSGFSFPSGVAVDVAGNLYIADYSNSAVKMIPYIMGTYGTPVTLGITISDPVSIAVDLAGNLYVVDGFSGKLEKFPYNAGSYGTPITLASGISFPSGVALDAAGNVYTVDSGNGYVTKVPYTAGNYGTPVVLASGFSNPAGVAVDSSGNIYVVNSAAEGTLTEITLATPPTLHFANTTINTTSASQTVTISNVGNAPLAFTTPTTGSNPSLSANFSLGTDSNSCPTTITTLATGASCDEVISYAPTVAGATTGNLVFTDNNFGGTNAVQKLAVTGSTSSALTMEAIGQNIPSGTPSITLEFIVGYGGNSAPTTTPTLTVNGSATNVGAVTCIIKSGHNNCTASYNPSTLAPGAYTILATQPADGTIYTTDATAIAYLTILGNTSHMTRPVIVSAPAPSAVAPTVHASSVAAMSSTTTITPQVIVAAPAFIALPTTTTTDLNTDSDNNTKDKDKSKN